MRKLNRSIYLCLKHHENDINSRKTQKVIKLAEEINIDRRERTDLKKFKKTHRLFSSLLGNEDLGRSVLQEDLVSGERCTEFSGDLSKFSKLISFAIHSIKLVENLQFAIETAKNGKKKTK